MAMSNGWQIVMAILVTVGTGAGIWAAVHAAAVARRNSPDTYNKMLSSLDKQEARLERQAERIDAMEMEIDDLRASLAENHEETRQLRDGIEKLVAQIRAANMEPVWTPEQVTKARRVNRATLARRISDRFSVDEMNDLAFEFGLAADELAGNTRAARARALVVWAADRGCLASLEERVNQLRPPRPHL